MNILMAVTTAPDREKAIQRFQNDDNCRVFLISLKRVALV
jgi:SNF2 family DNA or RNA helicase